jgi:hypothetical protein
MIAFPWRPRALACEDLRMASLIDPIFVTIGSTAVFVSSERPPAWDFYQERAALVDDLTDRARDGALFVAGIRTEPRDAPEVLVAAHYSPSVGGFPPGVLIVPETAIAFVGAGTTLLAYQLGADPRRLWEDSAELGFWGWRRHGDTVVMSAELELAAWDINGSKLWTRFVEPPWTYEIVSGQVRLDIMGAVTLFGLREGPSA